ncbi:MAG: hypothetical protein GX957_15720 [Clostridiaceae bacterium]|nr:hypothetical protein [Clostridiaceae bacterium]
MNLSVFNSKKTVLWLTCVVILLAIVTVIYLLPLLNQSLNTPESDSVLPHNSKQENEMEHEDSHSLDEENLEEDYVKKYSKEEVIEMVEKIDPYQLKPTMSPKEIYELRTLIYSEIPEGKVFNFTHAITSCATQLAGIVTDNRYADLVEKDHQRWDEYDRNDLFGVAVVLSGIEMYIEYQPLLEDIKTAKILCIEGLEERNILKIIDANRIVQDLSRHFIHVPYQGEGEAKVDHGDIHNIYFKATKTLEGAHNLLSEFDKEP